jgi:Putative heavy-metal chelation
MTNNGENLLARIIRGAKERENSLPHEAFQIRGIWNVEYAVTLRPESSQLHLKHVCVQTNFVGSCYYETELPNPTVDESLIGRHVESAFLNKFWAIAALDAVYGNIVGQPDQRHTLEGTPAEKALARATVVCDEVRAVARSRAGGRAKARVVNVGVVGDFLSQLAKEKTLTLEATDFNDAIVDSEIHGVRVKDGYRHTGPCVARADIALVTGMTLGNDTMEGILATARANNTAVIFFAETGSNFAEVYLEAGATAVVAEPFPFYLSGAKTCEVKVFRSESRDLGFES